MTNTEQEIEETKTPEPVNALAPKKLPSVFRLLMIILITLVVLIGVGLSAYYYAGAVDKTTQGTGSTEVAQTAEEKELDSIGSDLNSVDKDLSTTTLDTEAAEIEKLDLSGV